jgi:hypothetical protein
MSRNARENNLVTVEVYAAMAQPSIGGEAYSEKKVQNPYYMVSGEGISTWERHKNRYLYFGRFYQVPVPFKMMNQ